MINWTLKTILLKNLKANPKNPRQISKAQAIRLEELIKKYGLIEKLIVDIDMMVIGGHQRLKILKKMKIKEVECWVPDQEIPANDIDRLCIGLNLNQGSWDFDILANEYEMPDLLTWGFSEDQLVGSCDAVDSPVPVEKNEEDNLKKEKKCPHCGEIL